MGDKGGIVAGVVGIATLVIVASIVFQYLSQKNSVPLTQTIVGGTTNALATLFKS